MWLWLCDSETSQVSELREYLKKRIISANKKN